MVPFLFYCELTERKKNLVKTGKKERKGNRVLNAVHRIPVRKQVNRLFVRHYFRYFAFTSSEATTNLIGTTMNDEVQMNAISAATAAAAACNCRNKSVPFVS